MIKEFTLGAVTWTVVVDDDRLNDLAAYGYCEHSKKKITIPGSIIPDSIIPSSTMKDDVEQILYHEVVHAILDTLMEYELSKNEEFVQKFSILLHQFEKTKK